MPTGPIPTSTARSISITSLPPKVGGTYLFDAASPGHAVDTVIAVYDSSGHRLAYDDDIAPGNTDSEASVALQAGHQYFLRGHELHLQYRQRLLQLVDKRPGPYREIQGPRVGVGFQGRPSRAWRPPRAATASGTRTATSMIRPPRGPTRSMVPSAPSTTPPPSRRTPTAASVQGLLGAPASDEMNVPGVAGARMNTFQGGTIYWSPGTGAHVVYGGIGTKYNSLGGPAGYGLPTSDEANLPACPGSASPASRTGAPLLVVGDRRPRRLRRHRGGVQRHRRRDGLLTVPDVRGLLGAPTSDEMNVPGVAGASMNTFQGGTIYWSPGTGAHVVYGGIDAKYKSMGGPSSFLGLPTTDELGMAGGRVSYFQYGWIAWTPGGGAYAG